MQNETADRKRAPRAEAAFICIALCIAGAAHAACTQKTVASSAFAAGLQGWKSNTPAQVAWQSSGGNPGGFIQFMDMTNGTTYLDAPPSFRGNYAPLENDGYLTYQHQIISETGVTAYSPYEIRLSGPGGAAKFDGTTPSSATSGWVTIVAPIVAGDWTLTGGTWPALLANVTDVQIDIELVTNQTIPGDTDIEGIDNIALISRSCAFFTPPA
jgi:hypothetical protein